MGKAKNDFTYVIGLEGGAEEGPLTLADLQPLLRERKVVGSTFVRRSDRIEWTTAADLPELKVRDVIESKDPSLSTAGQEMEKELELREVRSGVSWFFWIGALSLVNSGLAAVGIGISYAMGLGSAHLIAALGHYLGSSAIWISLAANICVSLAYLITGLLAWHGRLRLIGPAVAVYIADAILCVFFEQWLSVGLHGLALVFLVQGFIASHGARGIELTWKSWAAVGGVAAILSAGGFVTVQYLKKNAPPVPEPVKQQQQQPKNEPAPLEPQKNGKPARPAVLIT